MPPHRFLSWEVTPAPAPVMLGLHLFMTTEADQEAEKASHTKDISNLLQALDDVLTATAARAAPRATPACPCLGTQGCLCPDNDQPLLICL